MSERVYTDEQACSGIDAQLPDIETWPNYYPGYEIEITIPEFTCVCPRTGLPDFGVIAIRYTPEESCLELKSLKLYTVAFRNQGIFNENVVNRVIRDIVKACNPVRATVVGNFTPRGGISTKVTASWSRESGYGV